MAKISHIKLPDGSTYDVGGSVTVDQAYDSSSANPQSGTAVKQAMDTVPDTIKNSVQAQRFVSLASVSNESLGSQINLANFPVQIFEGSTLVQTTTFSQLTALTIKPNTSILFPYSNSTLGNLFWMVHAVNLTYQNPDFASSGYTVGIGYYSISGTSFAAFDESYYHEYNHHAVSNGAHTDLVVPITSVPWYNQRQEIYSLVIRFTADTSETPFTCDYTSAFFAFSARTADLILQDGMTGNKFSVPKPTTITVDQNYNAASANPQSGTAVAQALASMPSASDSTRTMNLETAQGAKVSFPTSGYRVGIYRDGSLESEADIIACTNETIEHNTTITVRGVYPEDLALLFSWFGCARLSTDYPSISAGWIAQTARYELDDITPMELPDPELVLSSSVSIGNDTADSYIYREIVGPPINPNKYHAFGIKFTNPTNPSATFNCSLLRKFFAYKLTTPAAPLVMYDGLTQKQYLPVTPISGDITPATGFSFEKYTILSMGNLVILSLRITVESQTTLPKTTPGLKVGTLTGVPFDTKYGKTPTVTAAWVDNIQDTEICNSRVSIHPSGDIYVRAVQSSAVTLPQYALCWFVITYETT